MGGAGRKRHGAPVGPAAAAEFERTGAGAVASREPVHHHHAAHRPRCRGVPLGPHPNYHLPVVVVVAAAAAAAAAGRDTAGNASTFATGATFAVFAAGASAATAAAPDSAPGNNVGCGCSPGSGPGGVRHGAGGAGGAPEIGVAAAVVLYGAPTAGAKGQRPVPRKPRQEPRLHILVPALNGWVGE